jgi:16S rRNA (guanine966-N2)-methyltransferase
MRIIAGEFRGRPLAAPASMRVRPTADRTRESLFNILGHSIGFEGLRVIDLFAGTGALGLEALSRGASFALFVDSSAEGRALLRTNIERLGLTGRTRIWRRDAAELGPAGTMAPFDLAFADPPYGKGLGERAGAALAAGGWLKPGALYVLEEARDALAESIPGFACEDRREFGDTAVGFFRFANSGETA